MSENKDKNAEIELKVKSHAAETEEKPKVESHDAKAEEKPEVEKPEEKKGNFLGEEELFDNNTIIEYKSLIFNFETFRSICGIFAGFEGFIISNYVKNDVKSEEEKSGIIFMLVSLILNVFVCMISMFSTPAIKWGYVRSYMIKVSHLCMFLTGSAAGLYVIAFMLFISKFPVVEGAKYFSYALTCACLCGAVSLLFIYLVGIYKEDRELKIKIANKIK